MYTKNGIFNNFRDTKHNMFKGGFHIEHCRSKKKKEKDSAGRVFFWKLHSWQILSKSAVSTSSCSRCRCRSRFKVCRSQGVTYIAVATKFVLPRHAKSGNRFCRTRSHARRLFYVLWFRRIVYLPIERTKARGRKFGRERADTRN